MCPRYSPNIIKKKKDTSEEYQAVINEKKRIKNGYDSLGGEGYNLRYSEEQDIKYDMIFSTLPLRFDDLIFDIGCGTGLLLERLNIPAVGLDLSPRLLETAKIKLKSYHFIVNSDAEYLPFRDNVFDTTISVTMIQNIPYPELVLEEIKRVSKFNGKIVITALKKAFTFEEFDILLRQVNFKSYHIFDGISLFDLIAIIEKWNFLTSFSEAFYKIAFCSITESI